MKAIYNVKNSASLELKLAQFFIHGICKSKYYHL